MAANPSISRADPGDNSIVTVEEDWELVVGEPDPESLAPQITTVFSPLANTDILYAAVDFNHHSQFEFASGGVQLQIWSGNEALATTETHANGKLAHNNERVTWTHQLRVADGQLVFAVLNGQSETWGNFGGGELTISVGTPLANLNDYNPAVSVQNTGIGFASNRVTSLVLKKVRLTTANGNILEDSTERTVFQRN